MKSLFFCLLLFTAHHIAAQGEYQTAMQHALQLHADGKPNEAFAWFERIALAEPDRWVPRYYAAMVLIDGSFALSDKVAREIQLDRAEDVLADARQRFPENAELLTLEGLLFTSYVAADPMTYGMVYSPKIQELHRRALAIEPGHPRAQLNLTEYEMQTARFFGKEVAPFCERLHEITVAFETYRSDVEFAPSHGLARLKQLLENCED